MKCKKSIIGIIYTALYFLNLCLSVANTINIDSTKTLNIKEFQNKFTPIIKLVDDKKYDVAVTECNKIMNSHTQALPGSIEHLYFITCKGLLGAIYYQKKDFAIAAPILEDATNLYSRETTFVFDNGMIVGLHWQLVYGMNAGESYENIGNYPKAKALYEKLLPICEAAITISPASQQDILNWRIKELKKRIEKCKTKMQNQISTK
ncbi:MAG: hypothetical protein ACE14V_05535 [bacterium]